MTTPHHRFRTYRYLAANGHHTFEVFNATSALIVKAGEILHERFGFTPLSRPIQVLDDVITDCTRGSIKLLLGWDNWTGFSIMADSSEGDPWVDQFGQYMESILDDPAMSVFQDPHITSTGPSA